ncbi:MAG: hypothetical protein PHZ00_04610 [Candidatus Peribacteraceae bacterium]|nr:hypothetical protein [Candidatus Peribacteraceae bacterium]
MNKHPSHHRLNTAMPQRRRLAWIVLSAFVCSLAPPTSAIAKSSWGPALVVNTEAFQIIDDSDAAANVVLKFGEGLNKTLTYNRSADQFEFNDDLEVTGTISGALVTQNGAGNNYFMGNVGVGTANPGTGLHVFGNDVNGTLLKVESGDYDPILLLRSSSQRYPELRFSEGIDSALAQIMWEAPSDDLRIRNLVSGSDSDIYFQVSGGEILRLKGSGNVGIGTTAPETKLEVVGTMSGRSLQVTGTGAAPLIYSDVSRGRIGIGTTSPRKLLQVGNGADAPIISSPGIYTTYDADVGFVARNSANDIEMAFATSSGIGGLAGTVTTNRFGLMTSNTERISIDTIGNVGIDTTVPETKLEVVGTMSGNALNVTRSFSGAGLIDCDNATDSKLLWDAATGRFSCGTDQGGEGSGLAYGDAAGIFVKKSGDTMTGALTIRPLSGENALEAVGTISGSKLTFGDRLAGSGSVSIRTLIDSVTAFQVLDNDGGNPVFNIDTTNERVGIGTAAPGYPLDVAGSGRFTDDIYLDDQLIHSGDTDTYFDFDADDITVRAGGEYMLKLNENDSQDFVQVNELSNDIDFLVEGDNDVNLLHIDAGSDRIGVGTSAPETKLEVVGTVSGSALKTTGNVSVSGSILTELNTGGGVLYSNTGTLATTAKGSSGQILVARGTAAPEFKNPTGSMVWYLDGDAATGTRQGATITMPFGMTATSVNLRAAGAPTGTALIVDINEGGTTLFSTRPEIAASATTGGGGAAFNDVAIAIGAELSIDIDQIGSTFAGSGITIQLNGIRKY